MLGMPFLTILLELLKMPNNISDAILFKKLDNFIEEIHFSESDKDKFRKHYQTEVERKNLGEQILLLLNDYNDLEKPQMMCISSDIILHF